MATGRIGTTPALGFRWSIEPAGGTTSLSGLDNNSVGLSYTPGNERVYRNGVLLSRVNDYTATSGNSITLNDATVAGDIIEVFSQDLTQLADTVARSTLTAKGQVLTATAASTPAVLTVGANDTVLTADSSTATGLKWAAVPTPTPTFTGCVLHLGADQNISNGVTTSVAFAATDYIDTDNYHDTVTNNTRITIPAGKGGKYLVTAIAFYGDRAGGNSIFIRENGSTTVARLTQPNITTSTREAIYLYSTLLLDAGDYIELRVEQNSGGTVALWGTTSLSGAAGTMFAAQFLGA